MSAGFYVVCPPSCYGDHGDPYATEDDARFAADVFDSLYPPYRHLWMFYPGDDA